MVRLPVCAFMAALTCVCALAFAGPAQAGWYRAATYGVQEPLHDSVDWATNDVAIAADNTRYVPDMYGNMIGKYAADGSYLGWFDTVGTPAGAMSSPGAIAISPVDGTLYVSDGGHNRILHLTTSGGYLGMFGGVGSGPGQFNNPNDLTVGIDGTVYVADQNNDRVQEFTAAGVFIRAFGTYGPANGQFRGPSDVALSPDGVYLYVGEWGGNRVQKFTLDGTYQLKFGAAGAADGQFSGIHDLAIASDGTIVVGDYGNYRIQEFAPDGTFVRKFKATYPASQFGQIGAVAVGPDDHVHVDLWDAWQVIEYQLDGTFVRKYGMVDTSPGHLGMVRGQAVAPDGSYWTVDEVGNRAVHLAADGTYIGEFGSQGTGPGQFIRPTGVDVAADGTLYVSDSNAHRVQHLSTAGVQLDVFGSVAGGGTTKLNQPASVSVAPDGTVWVGDRMNNRMVHLTSSLAWIGSVGSAGTGNGQFNEANFAAQAPDGTLWTTDVYTARVQHFSAAGAYLGQFASSGGAGGSISIAADGTIFVSTSRAYRYTAAGVPIDDLGANTGSKAAFLADGSVLLSMGRAQLGVWRQESTPPLVQTTQTTDDTQTCLVLAGTDAGAGISATGYSIDGGTSRLSANTACVANAAVPATLAAVARDRAGNDSAALVLAGGGGLEYSWAVTRTYDSVCFDFAVADAAVAAAGGVAYSSDASTYGAALPARQCFPALANTATVTARAYVRDAGGDVLTVERAASPTLDATVPVVHVVQTTHAGSTCFAVTASDPETGIVAASYSFDGGTTRSATTSACLPAAGAVTVVVRNGAGNDSLPLVLGTATAEQYGLQLRSTYASACFTLLVQDHAVALAAGMRYSADGVAFATQSPASLCYEGLANDAAVSATMYLLDRGGNTIAIMRDASPDRDRVPPAIAPVFARGWADAHGRDRLQLSVHDDESGMRAAEISFLGTTASVLDGHIDTARLPEGRGRLVVRATDRAGNTSTWETMLTVDHTPPKVLSYDVIGPRTCVHASDDLSGVVEESTCVALPRLGVNAVTLTVRDGAGNARSVTLSITRHASLAHKALNVLGGTSSSSASASVSAGGRYAMLTWIQAVSETQLRLRALGMLRGSALAGHLDPPTKQALRRFQIANGIGPSGQLGPLTCTALDRQYSRYLSQNGHFA